MGTFVHHELNTSDLAAAKKFYNGLFGWSFQDMTMPDGSVYSMFSTGENEGGGIQDHPVPGAPSAWLQYVGVASVKQSMAKAKKLGATVVVDFMPIPPHGALGIFVDPTGASCAVWEPQAESKRKAAAKPAKPAEPAKRTAKKAAAKPAKKAAAKSAKKAAAKPAKKAAAKPAKKAAAKPAKKAAAKPAKKAAAKPAKKKAARR